MHLPIKIIGQQCYLIDLFSSLLSNNTQDKTSYTYQLKNNPMKVNNKINLEKEKKLRPGSFTFNKRKTIRPTAIWWGWKTIS